MVYIILPGLVVRVCLLHAPRSDVSFLCVVTHIVPCAFIRAPRDVARIIVGIVHDVSAHTLPLDMFEIEPANMYVTGDVALTDHCCVVGIFMIRLPEE